MKLAASILLMSALAVETALSGPSTPQIRSLEELEGEGVKISVIDNKFGGITTQELVVRQVQFNWIPTGLLRDFLSEGGADLVMEIRVSSVEKTGSKLITTFISKVGSPVETPEGGKLYLQYELSDQIEIEFMFGDKANVNNMFKLSDYLSWTAVPATGEKAAEQGGADRPATAPESKPESNNKPKTESKGRSQ